MASRMGRSNRIYNWHAFPFQIDGRVSIGSSGAPTLITSTTIPRSSPAATTMQSQGIKSITRLAAGTYRVQLDDNYTSLLSAEAFFTAPVTGSNIAVDATTAGLSIGTTYQITAVGTATTAANYVTLGVPIGITAAVGVVFTALTTGTGTQSGAGTVKALSVSAARNIQVLGGSPDLMLNNQPFTQGSGGGFITFQTLGTTAAFTGTAMDTHTHDILVIAGQAAAGTDAISAKGTSPVILGKESATNKTVAGSLSATDGGVVAASAGTPAGTIALSTAATDPTSGSTMFLKFLLSNSSIG